MSTSANDVVIREARTGDAAEIAAIHFRSLGDTFLAKLGVNYLKEKFYSKVIEFPGSILLVAELNNQIKSFVCFARNGKEFETFLTNSRVTELPFILMGVLRNPSITFDILALLLNKTKFEFESGKGITLSSAELFSIASEAEFQSQGIGGLLVERGLQILRSQKNICNNQCFVRTDTERASAFYKRHGFELVGREKRGSTKRYILVQSLF